MKFLSMFIGLAVCFIFKATPLSQTNVTKKLKDFCVSHMSTRYPVSAKSAEWSCTQSIKRKNTNKTSKSKRYCFCTQDFSCVDREHFHLETDLVVLNEYVNRHYTLYYKKECEQGINMLTSEKMWSCDVQFDGLKRNEFYCECRRDMVCQRHKLIKLKKKDKVNRNVTF
jgi:hypothetical protein